MLTGTIKKELRYEFKNKKFAKAMEFINRKDLSSLAEGWYELGEGVRASVQRYATEDASKLSFETHEKFYDLQYVVSGEEAMGVSTRDGLVVKTPYNGANDITFYKDPKAFGTVVLNAGDYIVLAPEDAHKPRCTVGKSVPVVKIVVKVPVEA